VDRRNGSHGLRSGSFATEQWQPWLVQLSEIGILVSIGSTCIVNENPFNITRVYSWSFIESIDISFLFKQNIKISELRVSIILSCDNIDLLLLWYTIFYPKYMSISYYHAWSWEVLFWFRKAVGLNSIKKNLIFSSGFRSPFTGRNKTWFRGLQLVWSIVSSSYFICFRCFLKIGCRH